MSEVVDPLAGPVPDGVATDVAPVTAPRMARHRITLEDGHVVGITVAGAVADARVARREGSQLLTQVCRDVWHVLVG